MKTCILLVNFTKKEQKAVTQLGVDAHLGYLGNPHTAILPDGSREQRVSFYSPDAIYDYKAIFVRLTKNPPLENELKKKAKDIGGKEKITFFKYWHEQKGVLGIFTEDGGINSLFLLGIPYANLIDSRGNDKTMLFSLKGDDRLLRVVLKEIKSLVVIPPQKYIEVEQYESTSTKEKWAIFPIYENRNDEKIGVYFNWGYRFSDVDAPAFLILPEFRDYPEVITKLLKTYGRLFPKYFPEICDLDWMKNDKYYPKEVSLIDDEIKQLVQKTEKEVKNLQAKKTKLKRDYSYLHGLLTESGDKLKKAVIKTLSEVFKLDVKDMDKDKKINFKEDILIKESPPILTEVKGTKRSYPSFTYVTQVLSNLLKGRDEYPDAIGSLILNLDRNKEPNERSDAYTKADEEKQLKEIVYIDTRVLFDLSIAVIDHKMPIKDAKDILFQKGRVKFELDKYLKQKQTKGGEGKKK
jgi:hypothetical protein